MIIVINLTHNYNINNMKNEIWDNINVINVLDFGAFIVQFIFVTILLPCKMCKIANAVRNTIFNVFSRVYKAKICISIILIIVILFHLGFTVYIYLTAYRIKTYLEEEN